MAKSQSTAVARAQGRKAKARSTPKRPERPFCVSKAGPSIKRLAEYLEKCTLHEKAVAVFFSTLVADGDMASALQESGAYDGDINNDLGETWWDDVATGKLDVDDAYVRELLRVMEH